MKRAYFVSVSAFRLSSESGSRTLVWVLERRVQIVSDLVKTSRRLLLAGLIQDVYLDVPFSHGEALHPRVLGAVCERLWSVYESEIS